MSRSKLEDALYESMRLLSMSERGFPMPAREFHPFWCCEHTKVEHEDRGDVPWCLGCLLARRVRVLRHEYRKGRNWRCDFAWPELRLIVEVEGGVYTQGRHVRPSGFTKDIEKYNAIAAAGWTLQRFSRREVTSGEALNVIQRVIDEIKAVEESRP